MNPEGLRFPDECCRHKALDLIGDLALIGKPLLGHVIAEKAGHAMHFALVNKIMSDPTIYEIITHEQLAMEAGAFFQGRSLRLQRPASPKPASFTTPAPNAASNATPASTTSA